MAESHHECKCGKHPGCFVWWISFHQNSNLQNLLGYARTSLVWISDVLIFALSPWLAWQPDLEISWRFLRGHDIFRKTSYLLVFLTFNERPVLSIANETFNLYGNIWMVSWIEHTNRTSCAFVLSGDQFALSYRIAVLHNLGI